MSNKLTPAQKALKAWEIYQKDMRPETRNDFLRAYALAHEEFKALEAADHIVDANNMVDVESLRVKTFEYHSGKTSQEHVLGWNDCIDYLHKRGLLRGKSLFL